MAKAQNITNGLNARFEVAVIPNGQSAPASTTLTVGTAAASGATSVTFTTMPKPLAAGDRIKIGSQYIYVANAVAVSASPTTVQLQKPTTAAIAASATTEHMYLHPLSADKASVKFAGKTVELSGFGDGLFSEFIKNAIDGTISVSGKYSNADLAYSQTILPLSTNSVNQLYFVLTDDAGAGLTYSGRATINDCSYDVAFRGVGEYSVSMQANGQVSVTDAAGVAIASY